MKETVEDPQADTQESPFVSFFKLWSPKDKEGNTPPLSQRVYDIYQFLALSLIGIITGFVRKKNLRRLQTGLILIAAKVHIELNTTNSLSQGIIGSLKKRFTQLFWIYAIISASVYVIDALMRLATNYTFLDYDISKGELSRIEQTYKAEAQKHKVLYPSPPHSDAAFEQERTQSDTLPKLAKSFFTLTQKMILVMTDLTLYWTMLPHRLFFQVVGALLLASIATYFFSQPETELLSRRKELNNSIAQKQGQEKDKHLKERNIMFLKAKVYSTLNDLTNKLIEEGFYALMLLMCAWNVMNGDCIGNEVADVVWMTSTIAITKDAYRSLLDSIKEIRTYQEFGKIIGRVVNAYPNSTDYFNSLNGDLLETYFPNRLFRVFMWSSIVLFLYSQYLETSSIISLTLEAAKAHIVTFSIASPVLTALLIVTAAATYRWAQPETINIGLVNSRALMTLVMTVLTLSNIWFVPQVVSTLTLTSLLAITIPIVGGSLVGVYAGYLFDKHLFQKIAFISDVILIFTSQTIVLLIHNLLYSFDKIYRQLASINAALDYYIAGADQEENFLSGSLLLGVLFGASTLSIIGVYLLPGTIIHLLVSTKQMLTFLTAGVLACHLMKTNRNTSYPIAPFLANTATAMLIIASAQYSFAIFTSGVLNNPRLLLTLLPGATLVGMFFHRYCFKKTLHIANQLLKLSDSAIQVSLENIMALPRKTHTTCSSFLGQYSPFTL